jgi:hypothetical protein
MAELVMETGIKRETGYLYFLSKDGNIMRTKMNRLGRKAGCLNKE